MSRKLTKTVVYKGNVYEAGTSESDIDGASKIGADVWEGKGSAKAKSDPAPTGFDKLNLDELKAEADKRGLEVEGTGKDGNVLKADLVAALEADDKG